MKCAPPNQSPIALQPPETETDDSLRMLLIRGVFRCLSVLAVCLASPFPCFHSKRRIGLSSNSLLINDQTSGGRGSRRAAIAGKSLFCGSAGASPSLFQQAAKSSQNKEVILIRGAALGIYPYWPRASDLAGHLEERGFALTIINHYEYPRIAHDVVRAVRAGQLTGGVSLVGYSFGADTAALLAELLDKQGIRVESMVLIESTWGTPVPGNVDHCVNYYKSRVLDFIPSSRGVPVVARSSRTQLTNINVGEQASLADIARHSHFTIGDNHRLHRLVGDFLASRRAPEITGDSAFAMTCPRPSGAVRPAA